MIIEGNDRGYDRVCRIPGVCVTAAGTVLVCYECRRDRSDWADIDIAVRRSSDGGKSFSERKTVVRGGGGTVNNPVLIPGPDKVILMWQREYFRTFTAESRDDGVSFENVTEITSQLRRVNFDYTVIACGPGHGIYLGGGRYAVSFWMAKNKDRHAHHPSVVSVAVSDDGGKNWRPADYFSVDGLTDPSEISCAALDSSAVLLNIRNESPVGKRYLARFDADSMSFEKVGFCDDLPDPVCFGGTAGGGDMIYYSGCCDTSQRKNLTVKLSRDGGKTFRPLAFVSEFAGYSDIAVSNDGGTLYIFYEKEKNGKYELRFDAVVP